MERILGVIFKGKTPTQQELYTVIEALRQCVIFTGDKDDIKRASGKTRH